MIFVANFFLWIYNIYYHLIKSDTLTQAWGISPVVANLRYQNCKCSFIQVKFKIMFIAKFNQTSGAPFIADRHENMPFIGEVLSGKAESTLINGTMFKRANLKENTLYACENVKEMYEGKPQHKVVIISEISVMEYLELRKECGAPVAPIKSVSTESAVSANTDAFEA